MLSPFPLHQIWEQDTHSVIVFYAPSSIDPSMTLNSAFLGRIVVQEAERSLLRNDARKEYARYGKTSTLPRLLLAGLDSIGEVGFIGSVAAKSSDRRNLLPAFLFFFFSFDRIGTRERRSPPAYHDPGPEIRRLVRSDPLTSGVGRA